jgi:nitrite reductase/ring-hydroxylating ferredoxin subunit
VSERPLCRVDDIAEPGARGFTLETAGGRREVFVVRRLGHVFAYENACPHIGTPLDFMPDKFLTRDGRHLLCSTHGALFEIATGLCLHGPCKGRSLRSVPVALRDGMVVVTDQPGEFG